MKGYSNDNYITDQDYFSEFIYRGCSANYNGCGPIAVYNLMHYSSLDISLDKIISEMNDMYLFKIPGPTSMKVLKKYLEKYFNTVTEYHCKLTCIEKMCSVSSGIIRYNETGVPHLVFFYKVKDEAYRFFNVNDGLEDCILSIEDFSKRILPGYVVLITTG